MRGLAFLLDPDTGDVRVERFVGDAADLHRAVGGFFEPAPTGPAVTLWCNEDGKGLRLPRSIVADFVWSLFDDYECLPGGDYLVGSVVLTGGHGPDGETLDLDEWIETEVVARVEVAFPGIEVPS